MKSREILEMATTAAAGFSALLVAGLGVLGLRAWKRRAKFEVARKMIQLAKKFANEIQQTRNPFGYTEESEGRRRRENETLQQKLSRDEHFARTMRLGPAFETLRELHQASWEAEVLLNTDLSDYMAPFITVHNRLMTAIEQRYMISEGLKLSEDESREMMQVIYGPPKPDDSISNAWRMESNNSGRG